MTKKNLKPQQTAPVQREINTTSSEAGTGLTPQWIKNEYGEIERRFYVDGATPLPFAGDDAE